MILYSLYSQDIIVFSFFVFFFKQKTAYEMRISDWSSDVCSSDLESVVGRELNIPRGPRRAGDPAVLVASSGKARELLGWKPARADISQIVADAWAWHRQPAF